jgi:glutathione S-transferase
MGDIPLGCIVYRYFNIKVNRPKLPNVEAWYQRLSERPAYRKNVMRHFGENPTDWAALEKASASEGKI